MWYFLVEVGGRDYVSNMFWRALGMIGVVGATRRNLMGMVERQAVDTSRWIWRQRDIQWKS